MQPTPPSKLVFFGTSDFAVPSLNRLAASPRHTLLVVSQPDRPSGRAQEITSSAVAARAKQLGLALLQPESFKNPSVVAHLTSFSPVVGVVVSYGKLIPAEVLALFPRGILNLHPSLLPKYRGPSPVQTALLHGERMTGASIMLLDAEMDHGPVLEQEEYVIAPTDTSASLRERVGRLGAQLLVRVLCEYLEGRLQPFQQDHSQATFTKIITRQDGQVDWSKSAEEIERRFRAYFPWPGIFTHWQGKRLKIAKLSVAEAKTRATTDVLPGTVVQAEKHVILVRCGQGSVELHRVQLEGKPETVAYDFARGYSQFIGARLG